MRNFIRRFGSGRKACSRHKTHLQVELLDDRTVPSTFTVSNVYDSGAGSLRQAISSSNSTLGPNEIDFASGLSGTITLTGGELKIANNNVKIVGPGASQLTVSGNYASRVFEIASGTVVISGLTISNGDDTGFDGAGIENSGTLTLNQATVSGNRTNAYGGGIGNTGTLTLTNSTVRGNSAGYGGGIRNSNTGMLTLTNSTVSYNSAGSGGGGIADPGIATVTNCTISGNNTRFSGPGGGIGANKGKLNLGNTILAGNFKYDGTPGDFAGTLNSLGYNLIGNTSGGRGFTTTDLLNVVNPGLGPLQDNGGPTWTMALLPNSPAINAGDPNFTPPPTTDQRGLPRKAGGRIDIGAFELQSTTSMAKTTTSLIASPNPSVSGQAVPLTATVSAVSPGARIPTGAVTSQDGWIALGTVPPDAGGMAAFPTSSPPVGSHPITVTYRGTRVT